MSTLSRREILRGAITAAACCPFVGTAHGQEALAVHNWMLVGGQSIFLSHLPMFEELNAEGTDFLTPHRFQVILEAFFRRGASDQGDLYFAERRSHPEVKMFTVSPTKRFVLADVTKPAASFGGIAFRGHLERGGQPIDGLTDVVVEIKKLIHFRKFDPRAQAPERLEYILFGKGVELFLAHRIAKPPDFDQIVSVSLTGLSLDDVQLSRGPRIIVPGRKNSAAERIREGQEVAAEMPPDRGSPGGAVALRARTEFYFEEGELRIPPTFDPTPEERKSGFGE